MSVSFSLSLSRFHFVVQFFFFDTQEKEVEEKINTVFIHCSSTKNEKRTPRSINVGCKPLEWSIRRIRRTPRTDYHRARERNCPSWSEQFVVHRDFLVWPTIVSDQRQSDPTRCDICILDWETFAEWCRRDWRENPLGAFSIFLNKVLIYSDELESEVAWRDASSVAWVRFSCIWSHMWLIRSRQSWSYCREISMD